MSLGLLFILPLLVGVIHLQNLSLRQRQVINTLLTASLFYIGIQNYAHGFQVMLVGGWPHFAGITWIFDELSGIFALSAILLYPAISFSLCSEEARFQSLFHFFFASVLGSFLTADLFNLFVMFEILLTSSYALFFLSLHPKKAKNFIWINLLGSSIFLFALAYLYRFTGSLNMADVAIRFESLPSAIQNWLFWIFSFVFLLKGGIAPLLLWLPGAYKQLPYKALAFICAISTKVGLYCFLRLSLSIAPNIFQQNLWLLECLGVFTILLSLLLTFGSKDLKQGLIYFCLSHIGFLFLSFTGNNPGSLEGFFFYLVQDVLIVAALFLYAEKVDKPVGDLFKNSPLFAIAFITILFAAAGFPPLSGFWAKWVILKSLTSQTTLFIWLLVTAILFSLWILMIWLKIFVNEKNTNEKVIFKLGFSRSYLLIVILAFSCLSAMKPSFFNEKAEKAFSQEVFVKRISQASQEAFKKLENKNSGVLK